MDHENRKKNYFGFDKSNDKLDVSQKVEDEEGKSVTIQQILDQHKGKVLVIDFWAGCCRDCLKALSKAKELEEKK